MRTWTLLVPLTALGAGLLFATSASTAQGTDLRAGSLLKLTELIARERSAVQRQERSAIDLREEVERSAAAASVADSRIERARAPRQLEVAAGLVAVRGPAVSVSLDDAPRRKGRPLTADPDDLVVHQQDLEAVVNALWAGGAEAMTLMGQRIVSTSAVRCVGNTVILHGRVYSPPFVVQAVGDPRLLRSALAREPGVLVFRDYVERFGLRYTVETDRDALLPAYDGPLELPNVVQRPLP